MEITFHYKSEIQSVPTIRENLETLAKEWDLPASELRQITLIIEELFSNTIRFGFDDNETHQIQISISYINHDITIEITDDGIPFNPLDYDPGIKSDPVFRNEGGMGLALIRAFSDFMDYKREKEKNILIIRKAIRSNTEEHE